MVTVHGKAFSELKMPYDTVVVTDFADLECEASAKSVAVCATREQQPCMEFIIQKSVEKARNILYNENMW